MPPSTIMGNLGWESANGAVTASGGSEHRMIPNGMAAWGLAALLCFGASCSSEDADSGSAALGSAASAANNSTDTGSKKAAPDVRDSGAASALALPADWPAELALPAGVTPTEVTGRGTQSSFVAAVIEGDVQTVYNTLKKQLAGAGGEIVASTFTATDTGGFGSISAKSTSYTVAIAFGPNPTGKINQVTINLADLGG